MSRRILTADDVAALPADQPLVVDAHTTLTDSARDMARRRGVQIVTPAEPGERPRADAAHAEQVASGADAAIASEAGIAHSDASHAILQGKPGRLIVTAVGLNRPAILAELTVAVGELGGDIQDLSQRITGGYFHAILVVDITRSAHNFSAYRDALKNLSEPSDYVVTVVDERVFRAMHRL
ncbi:MAG: hypothetical protein DHS20C15_07080 [Planctomycetota bacterium]|nr:MAG: hypothetical protein DHS20C15_07080 [Planctomycetota bacterium]